VQPDAARRALERWRADFPADPYESDAALRGILARRLDLGRAATFASRAQIFGRTVVDVVGPRAQRYEHREHLPELRRWDGLGNRVERVEFDPAYHEAGAAIWAAGIVADSGTPGRAFEQATLLYLLSLEGEAGHACPAVCTIGLARALRRRASDDVRARFLPPLLRTEYARADRASQFLTEVQGGSDVGANACHASPLGDGTYSVTGEKWFCSVADAQQFLVTARVAGGPPGTRGLGCFVIPRELDDRPNGFTIRRLKEKLGTRGMASGEIDLDGAVAWPIGPVEDGFKTAVGIVLNTSRWMTALGSTGMMRRAYLEAESYARHRQAFGQPIRDFPAVAETLERMRATWLANLHLTFTLTGYEDTIDRDEASDEQVLQHRFLVNVAKYAASRAATDVVRDGIEVLGGNGTIEDFSVLPRLYRDCIVYESWEGTHNVLVAQVLNDLRRLPILEAMDAFAGQTGAQDGPWKTLRPHVERAIAEPDFGARNFRAIVDRWVLFLQCALLAQAGETRAARTLAT
jgi:alkylation response protein AidB-like acyl-CoA dehydrogenase